MIMDSLPIEMWGVILRVYPYDIHQHNEYKLVNKLLCNAVQCLHTKLPKEITVTISCKRENHFDSFKRVAVDGSYIFEKSKAIPCKEPEKYNGLIRSYDRFAPHGLVVTMVVYLEDMLKGKHMRYSYACFQNVYISFPIALMLNPDYSQKCKDIIIEYDFNFDKTMICYNFV